MFFQSSPPLVLALTLLSLHALAAEPPKRPPIVGIANIAVKTESLEAARKFYSGVVGLEEAFTTSGLACFKVNDRQYVEVSAGLRDPNEDRLIRIGFETTDARALRAYLAAHGVTVPKKAGKDRDGNLSFEVRDPDGHTVQFVQYLPGSVHGRNFGKHLAETRISDHVLHVGLWIKDPAVADRFYKDVLGFRDLWKGGNTDTSFEWISLLVPDGHDWLEYMVSAARPTPQRLGVLHHVCLGTLDIQKVYATVKSRGYDPPKPPNIARDGRWLLHLYDTTNTRTEIMIRKPVRTPCCSPLHDDPEEGDKP